MKKYYGAVAESKSVCLHEIRRRCMHLSARICLLMLSQVRFRSFHLIKVWDYMEAAPLPSLCLHPPFLLLLLVYLFSGFFSFFFSPFFFSFGGSLYLLYSLALSFSLSLAILLLFQTHRFVLGLLFIISISILVIA